jgi:hypothetical protein
MFLNSQIRFFLAIGGKYIMCMCIGFFIRYGCTLQDKRPPISGYTKPFEDAWAEELLLCG